VDGDNGKRPQEYYKKTAIARIIINISYRDRIFKYGRLDKFETASTLIATTQKL
jgi:hypothetical protein